MIRVIVSVACCALIAPMAFAKGPKQGLSMAMVSAEGITVTGSSIVTVADCTTAKYQPPNMLVIHNQADPNRYVLDGPGHVFNSKGEQVGINVRPGASVRAVFVTAGGVKTLDHVVVD